MAKKKPWENRSDLPGHTDGGTPAPRKQLDRPLWCCECQKNVFPTLVFGAQVYQREVELDSDEVLALCERWLREIKPRLQRRVSLLLVGH